jgi:hypothetical protein
MPFMICATLATGIVNGAATAAGAASRAVRAAAMTKPIPLMNNATLTANNA